MPYLSIRKSLFALLTALSISSAFANTSITTPSLADVYSQASFDARPLIVDWLPSITTKAKPALFSIDSAVELSQLFALRTDKAPTVSVFFVSSINYCGGKSGVFQGCASGTSFAVAAGSIANPDGDGGLGTISHELGHVLGLDHVAAKNNLMANPQQGFYLLDKDQVATISTSSLISSNSISLRPISLSPVPEPETYAMIMAGLGLIGGIARRRKQQRERPD